MRKQLFVFLGLAGLGVALRRRARHHTRPLSPSTTRLAAPASPPGWRQVVYVALLIAAVFGAVIAGTFLLSVHAPPEGEGEHLSVAFAVSGRSTLMHYDVATFDAALNHIPNREPELESSEATRVEVETAGCSNPVAVRITVQLDPRWLRAVRATRLHEVLVLHTNYYSPGHRTFTVPHPNVPGLFGLAVKGRISQLHVEMIAPDVQVSASAEYQGRQSQEDTVVTGMIPNAELKHITPNTDFQNGLMRFVFLAPWISARGYQSCFLRLPALVGHSVPKEPLTADNIDNASARSLGPGEAETEVNAIASELDLQASNPAPNGAGPSRQWTCSRAPERDATHDPDCHATVALVQPNETAHLQLLTIILAALLSGALIALGAVVRRSILGL